MKKVLLYRHYQVWCLLSTNGCFGNVTGFVGFELFAFAMLISRMGFYFIKMSLFDN
jgi:hypothetical protein